MVKMILFLMLLLAYHVTGSPMNHDRERRADTVGADTVEKLKHTLALVSRQIMMQQFSGEEQVRSRGASGVKRERLIDQGSMPMYTATYGDANFAAIHNHGNYRDTLGLGELTMVMNGVEFRTRHMDYKMAMKSKTSSVYGRKEPIHLPEVPPEVTKLSKVSDQIAEMKEWFRAFKEQDYSKRDYREYFKPVLCYMEGAWTNSDEDSIDEAFPSDRHHLDATSWLDMQQKSRFTAYAGRKDNFENFAYLPTTIMDVNVEDGSVTLAQWNFNVACHPLSTDLPTSRLWPVEDVMIRLTNKLTFQDFVNGRGARFAVSPKNKPKFIEKAFRRVFIDSLMEEVPGMDNYQADLQDDALGDVAFPFDKSAGDPINAGYYHRWYNSKVIGAFGLGVRHRGYSDESIFMAMTTQSKIAGMKVERCSGDDTCQSWKQKWTYAIPLEIIYLTPLSNWNPYKITEKGSKKTAAGKSVTGTGGAFRNGENTKEKAYDGVNDELQYLTPSEFFNGEVGFSPADTIKANVYVLDSKNNIRNVSSSGHRVLMNVADVGIIRQRYPIMPIHDAGSTVWKQLEALTEAMLHQNTYSFIFNEQVSDVSPGATSPASSSGSSSGSPASSTPAVNKPATAATGPSSGDTEKGKSLINNDDDLVFKTPASTPETGSHVHYLVITESQHEQLVSGAKISGIITTKTNGHTHELTLVAGLKKDIMAYNIFTCDGVRPYCPDSTDRKLQQIYPSA